MFAYSIFLLFWPIFSVKEQTSISKGRILIKKTKQGVERQNKKRNIVIQKAENILVLIRKMEHMNITIKHIHCVLVKNIVLRV